ncbi:hypothetical protein RND81_10G038000 [Saponaria officinalis]|uniref:Uncharacterized protein n=1 Tax=Saponaria officinalis TaxID=3572 RepID=A0AAW1I0I6_SAPOF
MRTLMSCRSCRGRNPEILRRTRIPTMFISWAWKVRIQTIILGNRIRNQSRIFTFEINQRNPHTRSPENPNFEIHDRDWEFVPNSDEHHQSSTHSSSAGDFDGVIRSDYFSLDSGRNEVEGSDGDGDGDEV